MPNNYNKGEGPYDGGHEWADIVERDGVKLVKGGVEPLHEFDLREYHARVTGMPAEPPEPPKSGVAQRRR